MYFTPYIDQTGIHIPTYTDILDNMLQGMQDIYGQDIYLGNDSPDYQQISIFANKAYDVLQLCQAVFNSFSPLTAVGTGLDNIVQLNGISRQPANLINSYSTCNVTVTGTSGTVITNGVVQDINGYKWDFIDAVTIPASGTIIATVRCETSGAISANIGEISIIATPMYGWTSVTNETAATPGVAVETDAQLRARQAQSVAIPSQCLVEGLTGALLDLTGVTRCAVYENYTSQTDSNGIPAHSICAVVEGGDQQQIADAIYTYKTPGCGVYGDIDVTISSIYGINTVIQYFEPTYSAVNVTVTIKPIGAVTDAIKQQIQTNVTDYLNSLDIGATVVNSSLFYAAATAQPNPLSPVYSVVSVTAGTSSQSTADIPIAFNAVAQAGTIQVVVGS